DRDHLHQMGAPAAGLTCFSTRITAHNWLAVRQFAQHESVVLLAEVDHRQPGDMARAFKDRTGNDSLDLFGQVWSVERLARRRYRVTDQST
ncbi:MAG: hypothetical protein JXA10_14720, partial [Anaerolineae bacterium]|nr:hypothetical protein [Anaerolineae bacterium]